MSCVADPRAKAIERQALNSRLGRARKSAVAEAALQHEVDIINDPSGLTWDPAMAKMAIQYDAGLILNHTRGTPDSWARLSPLPDVMGTIVSELEACVNRARGAGVDRARIVVDPGIGFGKRKEQNSEILARLAELKKLTPYLWSRRQEVILNQSDPQALEFATAAALPPPFLRRDDRTRPRRCRDEGRGANHRCNHRRDSGRTYR
ncbi:MAG: dihydropteroate synthase [Bryobacteraceae bacterium]